MHGINGENKQGNINYRSQKSDGVKHGGHKGGPGRTGMPHGDAPTIWKRPPAAPGRGGRPGSRTVLMQTPGPSLSYRHRVVVNNKYQLSPNDFAGMYYPDSGSRCGGIGDILPSLRGLTEFVLGPLTSLFGGGKNKTLEAGAAGAAGGFSQAQIQKIQTFGTALDGNGYSVNDAKAFAEEQFSLMNPNADGQSVSVDNFAQYLKLVYPNNDESMLQRIAQNLADSSGNISKSTLTGLFEGAVDKQSSKVTNASFEKSLSDTLGMNESDENSKILDDLENQGYEFVSMESDDLILFQKEGRKYQLIFNDATSKPELVPYKDDSA